MKHGSLKRLKKVLETLQNLHGVKLDLRNASTKDISTAFDEVSARREQIVKESSFNAYFNDPEYTKTVLIAEALRIFLREIAPRRRRKKPVAEGWQGSSTVTFPRLPAAGAAAKAVAGVGHTANRLKADTTDQKKAKKHSKKKVREQMIDTEERIVNKIADVEALREAMTRKVAEMRRLSVQGKAIARAKVVEQGKRHRTMAALLEAELEQAEVMLAAKAMADDLQKMAQQLASMQVEDLMPLVDRMKQEFGAEKALAFNTAALEKLQGALTTVTGAKDALDNEVLRLQGQEVPGGDMGSMGADALGGGELADPSAAPAPEGGDLGLGTEAPEGGEEAVPAEGGDEAAAPIEGGDEASTDLGDFAGAEAAAGPPEEPLGRAKKESIIPRATAKKLPENRQDIRHGQGGPGDNQLPTEVTKRARTENPEPADPATGTDTRGTEDQKLARSQKNRAEQRRPTLPESKYDLPPEIVAALDDFNYYVVGRQKTIKEAKAATVRRYIRLHEGKIVPSQQKLQQAIDRFIKENRERLRRQEQLNGLEVPRALSEAIDRVGLTETEFRKQLGKVLAEAGNKAPERYSEIAERMGNAAEKNPEEFARWVAKLIEKEDLNGVPQRSYAAFRRELLDEARNSGVKIEALYDKLNEHEKDIFEIGRLHDLVPQHGFAGWYESGAMKRAKNLSESLNRIEGDNAKMVKQLVRRAVGIIREYRSEHGDLDEYGADMLSQLDKRYAEIAKPFEAELTGHLRKSPSQGT